MLQKIISGGQTGADKGALLGATDISIQTGGYAPRDFLTEEGFDFDLRRLYMLVETNSKRYPIRTLFNVLDSHGTAIFGKSSPGTRLTEKYCKKYGRPCVWNPSALELREFVKIHKIQILNVAGNRESTNPGIQERVRYLIAKAFDY